MAKRRDKTTRETRRVAKDYGVRANTIPVNNGRTKQWERITGVPEAVFRNRGRRGVRARARQNRIADRRVNGTYTARRALQPAGGDTTNS